MKQESPGRVSLSAETYEAGLSQWAQRSTQSRGREHSEEPCGVRTAYQRDRDRIVHCKSFRRLKHKTQVFISPEGDHYRTRLTHTLEVAGIARTVARACRLNEDLVEAIALGHDLGHTPFGHAGENVIDAILRSQGAGSFEHNQQSARVVEVLEHEGRGLNLTWEVRDGIRCHTGGQMPATLEARVVRIADRIAYINHDIDDALRAGLITVADLPPDPIRLLGETGSDRIDRLVHDLVDESYEKGSITQSPEIGEAMDSLRSFLFQTVYARSLERAEELRVQRMITQLMEYFTENPEALPSVPHDPEPGRDERSRRMAVLRAATDHVAGMTDRYAQHVYMELFVPKSWAGQ